VRTFVGRSDRGGLRRLLVFLVPFGAAALLAQSALASPNPKNVGQAGSRAVPAVTATDSSTPPAVISNGTVKLGVNPEGHLDDVTDGVGDEYLPTGGDALTPGCECEGWGVADLTGGTSGWASVDDGGISSNLDLTSFSSTATSAVSQVQIGSTFDVTQNYHPSVSSDLFEDTVTIRNISSATTSVRYRRVMDWDVPPTAFDEYVTVAGSSPALAFSSDDGFASADPLSPESSIDATGTFTDDGPADHGALFDFDLGSLPAGASLSFAVYYGAAGDQTDAVAALGAVGADVYSLGKPSSTGGLASGTPNTFAFGFARHPGVSAVSAASMRGGRNEAIPGLCTCRQSSGDPVNMASGDFFTTTRDAAVTGFGPPLNFERTYDSSLAQAEAATGTPGPLGYGWTDNWAASLSVSGGVVTVNQGNGADVVFSPPISGSCVAPYVGPGTAGTYCALPDVTASLTYDSSSSTYTFITHPYTRYTFDSAGKLTGEGMAGGATLSLSYNTPSPGSGACPSAADSCTTVTSASGRALVIATNSAGAVTEVSDPLGRTWVYGYCSPPNSTCSAGDLVSVTDPRGNVTSYTYDTSNAATALTHDLLTVTQPNGQPGGPDAGTQLTNVYDDEGRVIQQVDPKGNETDFDYTNIDSSTGTGYAIATDPDHKQTKYEFENSVLVSKTEGLGTTSPSTWLYNRDAGTLLDDTILDPDGHLTAFTHDANGNQTSRTNELGHTWTSSFNSFDERICAATPLAASRCASLSPPSAVTAGASTVSPISSAPPAYVSYMEYDTDGNPVYASEGEYLPGGSTASQTSTSYELYSGQSVTIGSHTDSCAASAPAASLPCASIDPDGVVTQLGYDGTTGDLLSSSMPDGNGGGEVAESSWVYDGDGEVVAATSPDGNLSGADAAAYTTTNSYDADGELTERSVGEDGNGTSARVTDFTYDGDGNLLSRTLESATDPGQLGYTDAAGIGESSRDDGTVVVTGLYTTGSGSVSLAAGKAYFNGLSTGSGTQSVRLVVYADNGAGAPSTAPVGVTDAVTITQSTPAGWITFPGWSSFGGAPTLAAHSTYWVGMWWGTKSATAEFEVAFDANGFLVPQYSNTSASYSTSGNPTISGGWAPEYNGAQYSIYFTSSGGSGSSLGYPAVGTQGIDSNGDGTVVVGGSYNTGSQAVAVSVGKAYFNGMTTGSGSQKLRLAIYPDDGSGAPATTPLAVSDEVTITQATAPGWITFSGWTAAGGAPKLAAHTSYWVGLWWGTQTGSAAFEIGLDTNSSTPQYYNSSASYSSGSNPSLPGGWSASSPGQQYSVYVVGTPSGPGSGGPQETDYAYDANDQQTLVTDADGNKSLSCYDGDGNLAQSVPPVGVAANTLTPGSCPTASTSPDGYATRLASDATTYSYDALGDKTESTTAAPAGQTGSETTTYSYDPAGQLLQVIAPAAAPPTDQETDYTYDDAGELLTVTKQSGTPSVTSYCYDPDGNRTATVAPDGNTSSVASCSGSAPYQTSSSYQTGYEYDSLGQLVSKTTPTTSFVTSPTWAYSYDPAGNLLSSEDPIGTTTTNTYTPLGQLATVAYDDGATSPVSYDYDADGNRVSMSDDSGTSTYSYDPFGELTHYQSGFGNAVAYSYDQAGNTTAISYPLTIANPAWANTTTVGYSYDDADQLTSVTDFNGNTIAIHNTADGLPDSETLGTSSDKITTSYDPTDTPSEITLKQGTSTLQEFAYTDQPSGAINQETDTPSSSLEPADYSYDAQNRVTSMTPGSTATHSYAFDASGNLTTLPTGTSATSYDNASELTSSTLSAVTTNYSYDQDGDRTQAAHGITTTMSAAYNGAQELTSYSNPAANMTSAVYDGDGLRANTTTTPTGGSSNTEHFTWDPTTSIPHLLTDNDNAYIYGQSNTPIEQVNLTSGDTTYLNTDLLGSVRGIVDGSNGSLTATTSYDAWGNPQTTGGLTTNTPFGYAGSYTDPTGLTYNIGRYYDPASGQFTSVDPFVDQTGAPYSYGGGDPVVGVDPTGKAVQFGDGAATASGYHPDSRFLQWIAQAEGTCSNGANWCTGYNGACQIGYGHDATSTPTPCASGARTPVSSDGVTFAPPLSEGQQTALLTSDLTVIGNQVKTLFGSLSLSQIQTDALVDFAYNLGIGVYYPSSGNNYAATLLGFVGSGSTDAAGITRGFELFDKALDASTGSYVVVPGLLNRRWQEAQIYLYGNFTHNPAPSTKGTRELASASCP
jgi:RHS repeat-associated protein